MVSIAGSTYLNGNWIKSNYLGESKKSIISRVVEKHSVPVISNTIARTTLDKPNNLLQKSFPTTTDLSSFWFTYLPDLEWFELQMKIARLGRLPIPAIGLAATYIAAALTYRGTVELNRKGIGIVIRSIETISGTVTSAYNAAKSWTSDAWNAIIGQSDKKLGLFPPTANQSNSPQTLASSFLDTNRYQIATTATASQTIDNFWDAIPDWGDNAWRATTKWSGDAWKSIKEWTPQTWQATTIWTAADWDKPFFTISNPTIAEINSGTNNLVFKVTLSTTSAQTITVDYATANNTATVENDYTAKTGTLTFTPGQISQDIIISVNGDTAIEPDETFLVNLSNPSNAIITDDQGLGTITNDDGSNVNSPSITLAISPSSVFEDGTQNLIYTFTRSGVTTNPLTVSYTFGGTATLATDYTQIGVASFTGTTGTVTFAANAPTAAVAIDPKADTKVESNETVALTLVGASSYTIGTPGAVVGTITNDDPRITLVVSPASVIEDGSTNLLYTFTRSGTGDLTTASLTVNYIVGGTAGLGMDYTGINPTGPSQSITFAAGSTTARVTVDPTADTEIEPNETVALTLLAGTGYSIGTPTSVVGTITNDDPQITLALSQASVTEDGLDKLIYTFARTGITTSSLTVNYTIGGTASLGVDYTGISSTGSTKTISFATGASTTTVEVDPTADTTIETDETVSLTLAPGTGYFIGTTLSITGTIRNDDLPLITLAVSPASVTEDGSSNLIYTFTRSGSGALSTTQLTVNYTVGGTAELGTDYIGIASTGATKSITFATGVTTASVIVDPKGDATVEPDETVALTLSASTGYTIGTTAAVVGTILNDDPRVTLEISPTAVIEDDPTNLIYTFRRTGPTTSALTVNYTVAGTATLDTDYTGLSPLDPIKTVTFVPGAAFARVTVNPTADAEIEADETVALTLAAGSDYTLGTTTAVVGTIRNDDPKISLAVSPVSVTEDGPANLIYTFTRTGAPTDALSVKYTVGGTAKLGLDYTSISWTGRTKTITFASGATTATVEVDPSADIAIESDETVDLTLVAGTGYTLGAKTWASGTIQNDDFSSSVTTTLGANGSSLLLVGNKSINGTGNSLNNTLTGNSNNNRLTGLLGADVLTGGGTTDSDLYVYTSLNESLLGPRNAFDQITDFNSNDRLSAPPTVAKQRLTSAFGNADSLTETSIAALFTASAFAANSVAAFTTTGLAGTFIAMNDARSGYQADSDAIVFLRNYGISSTNVVEFV
ncbi:MAG: Calx-beta domain-containing protein [Cyanobacteriota bacterium]|nr:Calx-beta domain-containing protein [Cyanobacteriota bacterium]